MTEQEWKVTVVGSLAYFVLACLGFRFGSNFVGYMFFALMILRAYPGLRTVFPVKEIPEEPEQ